MIFTHHSNTRKREMRVHNKYTKSAVLKMHSLNLHRTVQPMMRVSMVSGTCAERVNYEK